MKNIDEHEYWKSGFQLAGLSGGLKKELVSEASDPRIDELNKKFFEFDATPLENPNRTMKPFQVCQVKHGGLCGMDLMRHRGDMGSTNVYRSLWSLKGDLPLFVRITIPGSDCMSDQFLGKIHGRGDAAIFLEAEVDEQVLDDGAWGIATLKGEAEPVVRTFQMLLRFLAHKAVAATPGLALKDVTSVSLKCCRFIAHPEADHFAVRLMDVVKECPLSLTCSLAQPKKKKEKPAPATFLFGLKLDEDDDATNSKMKAGSGIPFNGCFYGFCVLV